MGSYGNCKYLPTFSLSYVNYAFVTVSDCIISYGIMWCEPSACIAA